jgi:hypothetical protein
VALVRHSDDVAKVSLGLLVVLGVAAVIVFFTGEPAEEAVEHLAGVSHDAIERHEEVAQLATVVMAALGVAATLALLWARRRVIPRALVAMTFAAALGAGAFMGYVANLGGQIRHTEIGTTASTDGDDRASDDEVERRRR